MFKVNHKLDNIHVSGARHGFRRRFQGFGSGESTGAKAPLWWVEIEKEAMGSEDLD